MDTDESEDAVDRPASRYNAISGRTERILAIKHHQLFHKAGYFMLLADVEQSSSLLSDIIIPIIPWIVIFYLIWLSGRWQSRPAIKAIAELLKNIAAIEGKLERIIAAIEKPK